MTQAQQQNLQVALREPVGRVFLVLACAGTISAEELYAHLNVVCPGQFSRRELDQAFRSPLVKPHGDSHYGLQPAHREQVIQHYARNYSPEYQQTCRLLLQQQEVASSNLRNQLWWFQVREALYRSGFELARARRLLDNLLRDAASPADVNLVRQRMLEYGHILVPSPVVRPYVYEITLVERLVQQGRRNTWVAKINLVDFAINANGDIVITVDKNRRDLFNALCDYVVQRSLAEIRKEVTTPGHFEVTYSPLLD